MPDRAPLSRRRTAAPVLALLLLCLPTLAGCGSADEEPRVQRVAYCHGPSDGASTGDPVEVEFRQGTTVVAQGSVSPGVVFAADVPPGAVEVFADGALMGGAEGNVPTDGPYTPPEPGEGIYLSGPGCPATQTG